MRGETGEAWVQGHRREAYFSWRRGDHVVEPIWWRKYRGFVGLTVGPGKDV